MEESGNPAPKEHRAFRPNDKTVKCKSLEQKIRLENCWMKLNDTEKYAPNLEDMKIPPGISILPYLRYDDYKTCRLVCRSWNEAVINSECYVLNSKFNVQVKPSFSTEKVNRYVHKYIKSLEEEWQDRRALWLENNKHNPSSIRKQNSLYTYATFKDYIADPVNRPNILQVPFQLPEVGETDKNPILQDKALPSGNKKSTEKLPLVLTEQEGTQASKINSNQGERDMDNTQIQCFRSVRISIEETQTDFTDIPTSSKSYQLPRPRKIVKPVHSRIPLPLAATRSSYGGGAHNG